MSNDTDVDTGDTLTVQTTGTFVGKYGTLVLNADGSYTYTVDNTNATVNALPDYSSTLTDTFSYTAKDAAGATSSGGQLVVTVHGQNDAPVAVDDTGSVVTKVDLPTTSKVLMYASTTDADTKIYVLDTTTSSTETSPKSTLIGTLDGSSTRNTSDIAITPAGLIYTIHGSSSVLETFGNVSGLNSSSSVLTSTNTVTVKYNGTTLKGITSLGSDADGNMYIATESGTSSALYKVDPTTGTATWLASLPGTGLNGTTGGASGDVAYFDGALYITLDNATIVKYDIAAGGAVTKFMDLPTSYFFGISFDSNGYMWLTEGGEVLTVPVPINCIITI